MFQDRVLSEIENDESNATDVDGLSFNPGSNQRRQWRGSGL